MEFKISHTTDKYENRPWETTMEFTTLEALIEFMKQEGESIIISEEHGKYHIEIYDDYRE